ncbi:DUF2167 domain-containing protein [Yoonia sp. I 8.24]|uniref:DUF2167 domain-containing protein n=1 Tax=Yoonia sp. I 8.24 TaxID=1537229 RepID=UPI001EDD745A|nr:DUF2167 domain-containing protein [Yoonia sp. I 8.24]MCG3267054.1 DUF2167 domain-containing protein [Yoonia sp. I 8.24]
MKQLAYFLREQIVFMAASIFIFSGAPAILPAQEINPLPFTEPLSVSRGNVTPASDQSVTLVSGDACQYVMQDWGWTSCAHVDGFVFFQFDDVYATVVFKPNSDGYVAFDDWESDEKAEVVAQIEEGLRQSFVQQGAALGVNITFDGWVVQPTLNKERGFMYYATGAIWGGSKNVNINATVFDRRGHIEFLIIPEAATMMPEEVEAMIIRVLDQYVPTANEAYASFASGDKVAAVGAVGVLAGIAGLKYSKAAGGLLVTLLLILKKAWFLLLVPFVFIKNRLGRKKD